MSEQSFDYVISGGAEGKKRLNILSEALNPYTKDLLEALKLGADSRFLDTGCGGGNVSFMAAEIAGPGGKVMGIDMDAEIVKLAAEEAKERGLNNIRFLHKGVYEADFKQEFDFVYARFLLSHLGEPLQALEKMKAAAKGGAMVVVEDIQFSGHFCYPDNPAFSRYVELYTQVVAKRGGNAEIGPALPTLFREAGLEDIGFDVIQPAFHDGAGKWMAYITLEKISESLIQAGLATQDELQEMLKQLDRYTRDEQSIISLPRIVRVWGRA